MRVHEIFLLVLSVFGIGRAQCGQTGYVNSTISCYLGQYFIPVLHPGLNSALCLELPNLKWVHTCSELSLATSGCCLAGSMGDVTPCGGICTA